MIKLNPLSILKLALLALVIGLVAAELSATVNESANAVAQMICADDRGNRHPKTLLLDQPVTTDLLADSREMRLLVGYDPEGSPTNFRGKLTSTVTRITDGPTRQKLGKVSSRQNTSDGSSIGERQVQGSVEAGDLLRWKIRLKKFRKLDPGQCVVVIAGFGPAENDCGPYRPFADSEYVLPYETGRSMVLSQGNCSMIGSHRGSAQHAYDFAMPSGTPVVAVRSGRVIHVEDSRPDGTGSGNDENEIGIDHGDGTRALYVHLQQDGSRVAVGDQVSQGQVIGLSGNSGSTDGVPHLHLQVTTCAARRVCGTEPITFSNAGTNRLKVGRAYRAR